MQNNHETGNVRETENTHHEALNVCKTLISLN
jgi:hypothetical protein